MEDLREQKQNQWITTEGDVSLWSIRMTKEDLFNEVSTRSMYFVKTKSEQPITSDSNVILDDDRNLYDRFMETAITDLLVLVARRCDEAYPLINDNEALELTLVMGENHDTHMLTPLANACKEYLVCKVLEQWYEIPFGSDKQERKIIHTLQFRRKSVARRVRSLL